MQFFFGIEFFFLIHFDWTDALTLAWFARHFFFGWSQRFCKENGWTFIILNSKLWRYSQKHRNQWHISVPMLKATKEHQFLRFPTFMSFSTHMTPGQVLSDDCTIYDSRHVSTNNLTKGHRRAIKYSIARFIRTARPPPLANCKTAVTPQKPPTPRPV